MTTLKDFGDCWLTALNHLFIPVSLDVHDEVKYFQTYRFLQVFQIEFLKVLVWIEIWYIWKPKAK